jgi:hypothetical protein
METYSCALFQWFEKVGYVFWFCIAIAIKVLPMSAHDDSQPLDPYAVETPITTGQWIQNFVGHYWVMIFFGCIFLTMITFPLVLLGAMPINALLMLLVFGLAITFAFVAPILIAPLIVGALALVFLSTPEAGYNQAGWGLGTVFSILAALGLPVMRWWPFLFLWQ